MDMNKPTTREAIAGEVRAALARDGRSAAELAAAAGMSRSSLSRKLRAASPFWVEEIVTIAAALKVRPSQLMCDERERQKQAA